MSRNPLPPIRKGCAHPKARFNPAEVRQIRRSYACNPRSFRQMAREYGCSHMTVYYLIRYVTYEDG